MWPTEIQSPGNTTVVLKEQLDFVILSKLSCCVFVYEDIMLCKICNGFVMTVGSGAISFVENVMVFVKCYGQNYVVILSCFCVYLTSLKNRDSFKTGHVSYIDEVMVNL